MAFAPRHKQMDFNPRSPCGERPASSTTALSSGRFQSTLPVRGATWVVAAHCRQMLISIHAPRAGSDKTLSIFVMVRVISIHAPRAGSDAARGA